MRPSDFVHALKNTGHRRFFSVPDSTLQPCLPLLEGLVTCSNEGEAVAVAAGVQVAGTRSAALIQNSGLGNALNPLTSLVVPFEMSLTLIVGYRGRPGFTDEPQHTLMGQLTEPLLRDVGFTVDLLEATTKPGDLEAFLDHDTADASNRLRAVLVSRDALETGDDIDGLQPAPLGHAVRSMVVRQVASAIPDTAWIVATTGKISRELEALADRRRNLYMVGSMGCAPSLGTGIAAAASDRLTILDGDGALMMRLEAMATVAAINDRHVDHVVLDNGVHESTGGQWCTSRLVDLAGVARSCGYRAAYDIHDPDELIRLLQTPGRPYGAYFYRMYVSIEDTRSLPRPSISPSQNWVRLQEEAASPVPRTHPNRAESI